jgi:hypothetical protein
MRVQLAPTLSKGSGGAVNCNTYIPAMHQAYNGTVPVNAWQAGATASPLARLYTDAAGRSHTCGS